MTGAAARRSIAVRTAFRSGASSLRVELTNTRSRWSGVRMRGRGAIAVLTMPALVASARSRRAPVSGRLPGNRHRFRGRHATPVLERRLEDRGTRAREDLPDHARVEGEVGGVEEADALTHRLCGPGQQARALHVAAQPADADERLECVRDSLVVAETLREPEAPLDDPRRLVHLAAQQVGPPDVVQGDGDGEVVPLRLGEGERR